MEDDNGVEDDSTVDKVAVERSDEAEVKVELKIDVWLLVVDETIELLLVE